jgi:hypothetical protein
VREVPGSVVCDQLGLSRDGNTLVIGWHHYDQNLRVRIETMDVPTKTLTMTDTDVGTGTYQNIVNAISVSDDGSRFAVGLWGDQGDVCPELRFYRRTQNAPVRLHNLTGSVQDLEMSSDGERVAVAYKNAHANSFASGGGFALYAFEEPDLRVLGVPSLGSSVTVSLRGPANAQARLLWAPTAATTPTVFPGMGTLHLSRTQTTIVPIGMTDATGRVSSSFPISAQAGQVGSSIFLQGLFLGPRRLTLDWARVTILP